MQIKIIFIILFSGNHTLAVEVEFDSKRTKFEHLCNVFWNYHDIFQETETPESQSTIFYHNPEQKRLANELLIKEQKKHEHRITTIIRHYEKFVESEE